MNTLEGKAWMALAAARGIGPQAMWRIADYLLFHEKQASWLLQNPERARDALKGVKGAYDLPGPDVLGQGKEREAAELDAVVLHPLHPGFPRLLRERRERLPLPALLYASGKLALMEKPSVSIVGRRDAGREALAAAEGLASQLAAAGIHVTSGYAPGIDCAAHAGALRSRGTTTLVLAEGLGHFRVKPEIQGLLADDNGLVISQFAPGERWTAFHAMARNKLVAALSAALVVIVSGSERDAGGRMSGSFDAAMAGFRLGITVFVAAPGFFPSLPAGNAELIRRGGRAWDPAAGVAPILEAVGKHGRGKAPGQRNLFE